MPSLERIEFIIVDVVGELCSEPAFTALTAALTGLDSPVFFTSGSATFISFVKGWRARGAFTGLEETVDNVLSGADAWGWLTGWLSTVFVTLSLS